MSVFVSPARDRRPVSESCAVLPLALRVRRNRYRTTPPPSIPALVFGLLRDSRTRTLAATAHENLLSLLRADSAAQPMFDITKPGCDVATICGRSAALGLGFEDNPGYRGTDCNASAPNMSGDIRNLGEFLTAFVGVDESRRATTAFSWTDSLTGARGYAPMASQSAIKF